MIAMEARKTGRFPHFFADAAVKKVAHPIAITCAPVELETSVILWLKSAARIRVAGRIVQ
jgi:hypothetical protein